MNLESIKIKVEELLVYFAPLDDNRLTLGKDAKIVVPADLDQVELLPYNVRVAHPVHIKKVMVQRHVPLY